jgi:hypothetical protein
MFAYLQRRWLVIGPGLKKYMNNKGGIDGSEPFPLFGSKKGSEPFFRQKGL